QGTVPDQVVTNMYFGGCTPNDSLFPGFGMQVVERVSEATAADPAAMVAACNNACNDRIDAYQAAHKGTDLPLDCETVTATRCDGLHADVAANADPSLQAGGPAETRVGLTGTVTLNVEGEITTVDASGIADVSFTPCTTGNASCGVVISRLDVLASQPFSVSGLSIDTAQVQNQGLALGT